MKRLHKQGFRHMVKELLVLSRLDNNRMAWNPTEFSMGDLISRCLSIVQGEAEKSGHTLTSSLPDGDIPKISADFEKVEQVLLNLIQNSIKYTPDNGKINVSYTYEENVSPIPSLKRGSWFTVKVSDNGNGIAEKDLPRIFERFYRPETHRNSDKGGTGLGLAISKEITVEHGGDITIDSTVGVGTTLTVYLPVKAKYIQ